LDIIGDAGIFEPQQINEIVSQTNEIGACATA
jgi:hypothetical protein